MCMVLVCVYPRALACRQFLDSMPFGPSGRTSRRHTSEGSSAACFRFLSFFFYVLLLSILWSTLRSVVHILRSWISLEVF